MAHKGSLRVSPIFSSGNLEISNVRKGVKSIKWEKRKVPGAGRVYIVS
jgi:hypothetical protein